MFSLRLGFQPDDEVIGNKLSNLHLLLIAESCQYWPSGSDSCWNATLISLPPLLATSYVLTIAQALHKMQRLVKWAQTCKAWLSRREDCTDNWSVPKGKCKTNVKNVHIRERACLPSQILLSLFSSIPQQTTGRMGNACKRKKEEFFYKVIIHLLKKENLSATDTDGAGEAGSSEKESLKEGEAG